MCCRDGLFVPPPRSHPTSSARKNSMSGAALSAKNYNSGGSHLPNRDSVGHRPPIPRASTQTSSRLSTPFLSSNSKLPTHPKPCLAFRKKQNNKECHHGEKERFMNKGERYEHANKREACAMASAQSNLIPRRKVQESQSRR